MIIAGWTGPFQRSYYYYCVLIMLLFVSCLVVLTMAKKEPRQHAAPMAGIPWDDFNFSLNGVQTDAMWLQKCTTTKEGDTTSFPLMMDNNNNNNNNNNHHSCLQPFADISLSPAATVLNYGQGLFEGLKAFRRPTDGSIVLFRPTDNALRMADGARRFRLPTVPTETFRTAVHAVVRANARWIPPAGKGALYLRPLLYGSGAGLGVKPSTEATFVVYASPVGNYFPTTTDMTSTIRLQIVQGYTRAARGGSGSVKAIGNYAPAFLVQQQVRARGFDEVLCVDTDDNDCLEEAGASNLFLVLPNNTLVTPPLTSGTILPGITRQSIIELARRECGCTVVERPIRLLSEQQNNDLSQACEAFCCGTGAVITPVSCISVFDGEKETARYTFGGSGKNDSHDKEDVMGTPESPKAGQLTRRLYKLLTGIQSGTCDPEVAERYKHWIDIVEP